MKLILAILLSLAVFFPVRTTYAQCGGFSQGACAVGLHECACPDAPPTDTNCCCSCEGEEGPPAATCELDMGSPVEIELAEEYTITPILEASHGEVNLAFSSSAPPGIISNVQIDSGVDILVTGVTIGTTTLTETVEVTGEGGNGSCSDTITVNVTAPEPWWQVVNGLITSGGRLASPISFGCEPSPICAPFLSVDGNSGDPGNVMYDSGTPPSLKQGTISTTLWNTRTTYTGTLADFNFFNKTKPAEVTDNSLDNVAPVAGNVFNSGGQLVDGYYWYKATGNTVINSNVAIPDGRKIILIIESGDLYINSTIELANNSTSFMAIVDGNIEIDSTVTGTANDPALEGLFVADGDFTVESNGATDLPFYVLGSVTAHGTIQFNRNLVAGNVDTPSEAIEYSPEMILNYPQGLAPKRLIWKEINP